jgi:hypothetical protein
LFLFSASSGALVLPDTPDRLPWFPRAESWATAYDIAHTDAGLFVALGDEGLGIFDATTFQMDEVASDPFLNHNCGPGTPTRAYSRWLCPVRDRRRADWLRRRPSHW